MNKLAALNTPIFWAEGHPGSLNRETWKIEVCGSCNKPQIFSWSDLMELPQRDVKGRNKCYQMVCGRYLERDSSF